MGSYYLVFVHGAFSIKFSYDQKPISMKIILASIIILIARSRFSHCAAYANTTIRLAQV